jgi:hypothetical protein
MEQLAALLTGDQTENQGAMVADRYSSSKYAQALDDDISATKNRDNIDNHHSSGFFRQLKWILWRTWIEHRRDRL